MSAALSAVSASALIALHTPAHVRVDLNPAQIVLLREASDTPESLLAPVANCVIATVDGKFISVVEHCDEVRALLGHLLEVRQWDTQEILRWSNWRRDRNRRATASHRKRRLADQNTPNQRQKASRGPPRKR